MKAEAFPFYETTFWYPRRRTAGNIFESVIDELLPQVGVSREVIGTEWWFSVLSINATPQWLLPCHFDRNDISETDVRLVRHPEIASVLFLNDVPYGDLVVTDQILTNHGRRPREPREMRFIQPRQNSYAIFPGHLYHGVIGRMAEPKQANEIRISLAVNYWTVKPTASYLLNSSQSLQILGLSKQ